MSEVVSTLSEDAAPKSVHRLRTTIRRIESLISYANPDLGKKLERGLERLEELRKRAGKVRDIDVQTKLLDQLGNGSTAKDRKTLAGLLEKKRDRQVKRLRSALTRHGGDKLFSRLERVAEKIGTGLFRDNPPLAPLEEARLQLSRLATDFSSHPAAKALKPNRLHEARIQLKKIRYLGELADDSGTRKTFLAQLKAVQDDVGEWHDWEELTKLAEKQFADRVDCALLREVRALFAARESAAVSAVTRLFAASVATEKKPPATASSLRSFARQA
ncbi:MAG TPA: CHAD domain-containing protein [Candidatus Angelobacter sp.]|nr:CHAD domain-containing protein [Candidatus Angelobacter sp.]